MICLRILRKNPYLKLMNYCIYRSFRQLRLTTWPACQNLNRTEFIKLLRRPTTFFCDWSQRPWALAGWMLGYIYCEDVGRVWGISNDDVCIEVNIVTYLAIYIYVCVLSRARNVQNKITCVYIVYIYMCVYVCINALLHMCLHMYTYVYIHMSYVIICNHMCIYICIHVCAGA